ncbi:phage major capsid protein [Xanthobacter autotrophicus]|uniref:phage major capsid protein n=1 Tax=Xanthobacter autotrophicus TaxID=280 RepID=UPI00372C7665
MSIHHKPAALLEHKDDNAIGEVKRAVDELMSSHQKFVETNDTRLKEIEKRGVADPLTVEKLAKIEKDIDKYEGLSAKFAKAELAMKAAQDEAKEAKDHADELEKRLNRPGAGGADRADILKKNVNTWARAVIDANTKGVINLSPDQQKALDAVATEMKSMSVSNDTTGGYLAPSEYVREIIKGVTEMSPARSLARIRTTGAKSVMIPKRTGQFAARRVGETETRTETDGLRFGMIEITAPEMYALIDISTQNLEDTVFDLEAEISGEATEQFAVREGMEFVSGTGVGQMEGILVNADVGTVNSGHATLITGDGLINLKYGVKTAYARNGTFVLNRTVLGSVRKLKNSNGDYIWQPGLANGRPNTIDGDPYIETPDMPNEAAAAKPVAYGDFRRAYTMVDRIAMTLLRDPFTQATEGMIRFHFRRRVGGQVVLPEAIKTLTIAA